MPYGAVRTAEVGLQKSVHRRVMHLAPRKVACRRKLLAGDAARLSRPPAKLPVVWRHGGALSPQGLENVGACTNDPATGVGTQLRLAAGAVVSGTSDTLI